MPYNLKPETRHEAFLDAAAGNTHNLTPVTREEMFLDNIANAGGGGGTSDYSDLTNKPQINSTTLSGNLSSGDLGLQSAIDSTHKLDADLVVDANSTNKFATAEELQQIETNKTNILSIQDHIKFDSSSKIYYLQQTQPSNPAEGDIWIG